MKLIKKQATETIKTASTIPAYTSGIKPGMMNIPLAIETQQKIMLSILNVYIKNLRRIEVSVKL
jgi:hypothetical protein